jgi:catechol 2,3-dioxygenase-like lactoylglutathione lyase family enzyme
VLLLGKVGASTQWARPRSRVSRREKLYRRPSEAAIPTWLFPIAAPELGAWESRLAEKGVAIEMKVKWERGGRSLYFRDPDGNLLEPAALGLWPTC